jgi:hypothetical protein
MQIDYIICPQNIEDKIESEHDVTVQDARQVLLGKHRIRFAEKGYTKVKTCTALLGRLMAGDIYRYSLCINQPQKQQS